MTTNASSSNATVAKNIDEYIAGFPPEIQEVLQLVRRTVHEAAPDAVETIKYAMPTFVLDGNLVYFGAFKNHLGFYPAPTNDEMFAKALKPYKSGRGSVQFPYSKPMPIDLITSIVKDRIEKNKVKKNKVKTTARPEVE